MRLPIAFREALDRDPGLVLLIDSIGVIRHVNHAWDQSAARDQLPIECRGGAVVGRVFLDFVLGELKPYVARAFERAAGLSNGRSCFLLGECNTPALFRTLTTRIAPLWVPGEPNRTGFMVHSDVVVQGALEDRHRVVTRAAESWRDPNGCIVQCGSCRRVRDPITREWAMCLELLDPTAEGISHGICDLCLETYYAEPQD